MNHVQERPQYIGLARPGTLVGLGSASTNEIQNYGVATLGIVGSLGGGLWGGLLGAAAGRSNKSTAVGAAIGATLGLIGGVIAGYRAKGAASSSGQ